MAKLAKAKDSTKRKAAPRRPAAPAKRRARLPEATGNRVLQAYNQAVRHIDSDDQLTATESSAGFIIPCGEVPKYQVFVRVVRFSDELLRKHPHTGGLLDRVS